MNSFEIVKFTAEKIELDVNVSPNEDTVWLTLEQIGALYNRDRSVIGKHIKNIYKESELEENSTRANFTHVQNEGGRKISREISYYNLDVVISVGYRVKSKNGILFRKWANSILKEYLIKGYVIDEKRTLITNENYVNLINKVDSIDKRLSLVEKTNCEREKIFFDGEIFDAKSFLCSLFAKAEKQIILIDPYADIKALDYLKVKNKNVEVIIYHNNKAKLSNNDVDVFNNQYGGCKVFKLENFHDRFVILDNKDLYHIGSSLNLAGRKTFAVMKMENKEILHSIKEKLGYE